VTLPIQHASRVELFAWAVSLGILIVFCTVCRRLALRLTADMNSDVLFLANVIRDLFVDHLPMQNWIFQPAHSLFPDGVLMAASMLVAPSTRHALFLYYLLMMVGLATVTVVAVRSIVPNLRDRILMVVAPLSFLFLESSKSAFLMNFYHPGHHGMAIVAGIASFAIAMQVLRTGVSSRLLVAFFGMQALTLGSDALYTVQGFLPLVTMLLLGTRASSLRLRALALLGVAIVALPVGRWIAKVPHTFGIFQPEVASSVDYSYDRLVNGLVVLAPLAKQHPVLLVAALAYPALGLAAVGGGLLGVDAPMPESRRFARLSWGLWHAFLVASMLGTFIAVTTGGYLTDVYRVRYLDTLYVLPVLGLASLPFGDQSLFLLWFRRVALGCAFVLTLRMPLPTEASAPANVLTRVSDETKCLDAMARATNIRLGYANYWSGRSQMFLSHEQLRFAHVTRDFRVHHWILNLHMHELLAQRPHGVFVYLLNVDKAAVEGVLGKPSRVYSCPSAPIYVYEAPPNARPSGTLIARELTPNTMQW
jgi:hypothetical protein